MLRNLGFLQLVCSLLIVFFVYAKTLRCLVFIVFM